MILNKEQKLIIDSWMTACTKMYNETLVYIRDNCPSFKQIIIRKTLSKIDKKTYVNTISLRSQLKNIRDQIQKDSQVSSINYNTQVYTHILDYAIKQLVTNIKSAITNLQKGTIKRFRIKFWKIKRPSKTIDIELQYIKNNNICPKILKDVIYEYNNKPYKLNGINCGVKINYNVILNEYYLLVPHKHVPSGITKTEKLISIDLGLRTFATGLSENQAYKIGNNVNSLIRDKLTRLSKIMKNENVPNKIKKKNEKIINRQIYNKIDDMYWKVISYLTKTFNTVVLGDMNAKSIVSSKNNIMSTMMKTVCLRSRFFDFKQRLSYKCNLTKTNFILVDEAYTSKTCSCCGNYNDKLGGDSVYNCSKCKMIMDRDINSCRDMMIKSKIEN